MSTVGEASEEVRGPVLAPDAPAELGGVVVDRPAAGISDCNGRHACSFEYVRPRDVLSN